MKKILLTLSLLALVLSLSACALLPIAVQKNEEIKENVEKIENDEPLAAEKTRVTALKGPTGMGMAKMMNDADEKYEFSLAASPADVQGALMSETVDIAAIPTNLASVLYNKTNGAVKVLALNTEGVLYVLDATGTVKSVEDLRGKTIGATGQGSTPEYILRYILTENGIDPDKDVVLEFYTEHAELATRIASGEVEIGMLPEPQVTTTVTKNDKVAIALNLTEEWNKIAPESALVQGCIVARSEFIEKYPDSIKNFLSEYSESVEYITTAEDAPEIIANLGIVPAAPVAKKALPSCNICYYDSNSQMKEKLSGFLEVLHSFSPAAVGGALPDDAFYYENN